MPRVSIIVPTYNGGKFIKRALGSIKNQTFQDFEVIVIDDASVDDTKEKIQSFIQQDSRFQLIIVRENSGGGATPRTMGCKIARGEFVAFLDQDDLYLPEYLEKKVAYFDIHPEINFLSSLAWAFDEDDKNKSIINCEYGGPVNTMVRREVLERTEYFKASQTNADDIGMWYRYLKIYGAKMNIAVSDEPLTLYARHIGQGSYTKNKNPHIFIGRIDSVLKEIHEGGNAPYIRSLLAYLYSRKAIFYCLAGDFKKGRFFLRKALKLKQNLSLFILWIMSFCSACYGNFIMFGKLIEAKIFARVRVSMKRLRYKKSYMLAKMILSE